MKNVGFIGLGLMGVPMVRRLRSAGIAVTVWNRAIEKASALAADDEGIRVAGSPAELARAVDVVMLCVADTAAVQAVVFGDRGVVKGGGRGKLLIDLSSIMPSATREFAERLQAQCGMAWVDAPVSGGVQGAVNGTLAIMAGGTATDVERARPLLAPLSRRVTHLGPVGSGQVAKVCNQMIVGVNALVIAEVVALAERAGVDAGKLPEAFAGGFADSLPLQILAPQMATRTFAPVKWHVRTLLKDLDNARALAAELGSEVPMSALGADRMREHGSRGYLDADPATLVAMSAGEVSPVQVPAAGKPRSP